MSNRIKSRNPTKSLKKLSVDAAIWGSILKVGTSFSVIKTKYDKSENNIRIKPEIGNLLKRRPQKPSHSCWQHIIVSIVSKGKQMYPTVYKG